VWWTVDGKMKSVRLHNGRSEKRRGENKIGRLLNEIGESLMEDGEYPSEPTLLYAQLDHTMVGEWIIKVLSNQLLFRWPFNQRLLYALL
jgi:hypothetical protein